MKKAIVNGVFLVIGATITGLFTYKSHKVEINNIIESSIPKTEVKEKFVPKEEYKKLKSSIDSKESSLLEQNTFYRSYNDSLLKELEYLKIKCNKIASITYPNAKTKVENMLFELEKVYREGKHIVLHLRLTNLGNDKNFRLRVYDTFMQAPDGLEYSVKKVFKGGKKTYGMGYDYAHNEDVLYIVHFGDVSSQLKYDKLTFKTVTNDKTQVIQEISVTKQG